MEIFDQQAAAWQDTDWLFPGPGLLADGGAPGEETLHTIMGRLGELGHAD